MNTALFNRIADVLETRPHRWAQWTWTSEYESDPAYFDDALLEACTTYACIAGWAVHLTPRNKRPIGSIPFIAAQVLGLTRRDADALFSTTWVPTEGSVSDELRAIALRGKVCTSTAL